MSGKASATAAPSSETVRALQVAHDALTDCVKHLMQRGPAPCPSFMATATGAVARALAAEKARAANACPNDTDGDGDCHLCAKRGGCTQRAAPGPGQAAGLTTAKLDRALAACRSIRFAVKNASRFGGEFSLNDILAADRLAREALGEGVDAAVPATVPAITKRSLAAHKANWTRRKKGGRS